MAVATAKKKVPKKNLDSCLCRYDTIVAKALIANPAPIGRKRDSIEREDYNLAGLASTER